MKQHITVEQLGRLSEKGKERYIWFIKKIMFQGDSSIFFWHTKDGFEPIKHDPLLSIGQMIEFLDKHKINYLRVLQCEWPNYDCDFDKFYKAEDVCDALWEAVKEVLEK